MGTHPLRIVHAHTVSLPRSGEAHSRGRLGALLLGSGQITPEALRHALSLQTQNAAPLGQILCSMGALNETALFDALALQFGTQRIDPVDFNPDLRLIDRLGAQFCAVNGVLPLARAGATTVVASCEPDRFPKIRPMIEAELGSVSLILCSKSDLHRAITTIRKRTLAFAAENRTAAHESCRSLSRRTLVWGGVALSALLGIAVLAAPGVTFTVLTMLALAVLLLNTAFTATMALLWLMKRPSAAAAASLLRPVPVSILVPLFQEKHIADRLIQRLSRLDYPADQLEILLVVEEDDAITRATLAALSLPRSIRVITVPRGQVKTKPRALNYALDFCTGQIVGVYDAEDAPDPGQIRAVVAQFQRSDPVVACLQGQLDYYNSRKNWMARCFTIEYAAWFRIMLPGMARLGLALPLGGTTLFFRKSALIALGGWDSHNVTEDADLGLRLARRGYRTDLLDSVTLEEANCRPWAWVRQRSRWQKGYAMTYFVHMRNPVALWRDLGARQFWGMQLLLLGSLLGVLTAPLLWAFALLWLGLPHPWSDQMAGGLGTAVAFAMAVAAIIHWTTWSLGAWARGDRALTLWAPSLSIYHAMASASALKAAVEIMTRPFFWDKTIHGLFSDTGDALSAPLATQPQPLAVSQTPWKYGS